MIRIPQTIPNDANHVNILCHRAAEHVIIAQRLQAGMLHETSIYFIQLTLS